MIIVILIHVKVRAASEQLLSPFFPFTFLKDFEWGVRTSVHTWYGSQRFSPSWFTIHTLIKGTRYLRYGGPVGMVLRVECAAFWLSGPGLPTLKAVIIFYDHSYSHAR